MIYSATTNSLTSEVTGVPGVVLAVSAHQLRRVVNDQLRGVSISTRRPPQAEQATATTSGEAIPPSPGSARSRLHRRWPDRLHRGEGCSISITPSPAGRPNPCLQVKAPRPREFARRPTPPVRFPPTHDVSAQYHGKPQQHLQHVLFSRSGGDDSGGRGLLSGAPTSAYGQCPETTVKPVVNYPGGHDGGGCLRPRGLYHRRQTHHRRHRESADTHGSLDNGTDRRLPDGCERANHGIAFNPPPVANQASLAAYGITNINQVIAATNSLEAFVTYGSAATTPPAGGALLPVYKPSTTAGTLGTLSSVTLTGNALAPVAGIFSPITPSSSPAPLAMISYT